MGIDKHFEVHNQKAFSVISIGLLSYASYFAFFVEDDNKKFAPSSVIILWILGDIVWIIHKRYNFFEFSDLIIIVLLFFLALSILSAIFVKNNDDEN